MKFAEKVYNLTGKVPKGSVTTYKEIAKKLKTRAYRAVGTALRKNTKPIIIPCHRVVKSNGTDGDYCGIKNSRKKAMLLKKEGIRIKNNKIVDFGKILLKFS